LPHPVAVRLCKEVQPSLFSTEEGALCLTAVEARHRQEGQGLFTGELRLELSNRLWRPRASLDGEEGALFDRPSKVSAAGAGGCSATVSFPCLQVSAHKHHTRAITAQEEEEGAGAAKSFHFEGETDISDDKTLQRTGRGAQRVVGRALRDFKNVFNLL
jgi:hypothetical protein